MNLKSKLIQIYNKWQKSRKQKPYSYSIWDSKHFWIENKYAHFLTAFPWDKKCNTPPVVPQKIDYGETT